MEHSMRIKQVEVNQPWTSLTSEQPIVVLSRNLKDPIVPDFKTLCERWSKVPANFNYLVAGG
jgi:hypothetical protein